MNILEKIVEDKRLEVAQRKLDFPCSEFESGLLPNDRNFKQALIDDRATKGAAYIFECKKASPSKGLIRENFDLEEICDAYSKYASCVSVLTDEKNFQGEFERLPLVNPLKNISDILPFGCLLQLPEEKFSILRMSSLVIRN